MYKFSEEELFETKTDALMFYFEDIVNRIKAGSHKLEYFRDHEVAHGLTPAKADVDIEELYKTYILISRHVQSI